MSDPDSFPSSHGSDQCLHNWILCSSQQCRHQLTVFLARPLHFWLRLWEPVPPVYQATSSPWQTEHLSGSLWVPVRRQLFHLLRIQPPLHQKPDALQAGSHLIWILALWGSFLRPLDGRGQPRVRGLLWLEVVLAWMSLPAHRHAVFAPCFQRLPWFWEKRAAEVAAEVKFLRHWQSRAYQLLRKHLCSLRLD